MSGPENIVAIEVTTCDNEFKLLSSGVRTGVKEGAKVGGNDIAYELSDTEKVLSELAKVVIGCKEFFIVRAKEVESAVSSADKAAANEEAAVEIVCIFCDTNDTNEANDGTADAADNNLEKKDTNCVETCETEERDDRRDEDRVDSSDEMTPNWSNICAFGGIMITEAKVESSVCRDEAYAPRFDMPDDIDVDNDDGKYWIRR